MDQIKIGKFIAERRKNSGLTQLQLAEMLNITDRAVSKWEQGRSLPDSSIMLELCGILKISVNDLLSGEIVTMDNYNNEAEKNLIEMIKQKEQSDKRFLAIEWVLGILSLIVLFLPIIMGAYLPMKDWQKTVVIFSGFLPALIGFGFAMKIEQTAGYYECQHCKHRYIPDLKSMYLAPHIGRTRKMKCPECGKKSWQKKVLTKE